VGWSQKLFDLLDEYLNQNKEGNLSLDLKNKVQETLNNQSLFYFDININELNLEKIICEFVIRHNLKHTEIFQNDYLNGTIGIINNENSYRIILLLA